MKQRSSATGSSQRPSPAISLPSAIIMPPILSSPNAGKFDLPVDVAVAHVERIQCRIGGRVEQMIAVQGHRASRVSQRR